MPAVDRLCLHCGRSFTAASRAAKYCSRPCADVDLARRRERPVDQRFWAKLNRRGPRECWEWSGCKNENGYGQLYANGSARGAHRVAWELMRGAIPDGRSVLHRCDNPACCNPDHLFLGDHTANMRDMVAKGRGSEQRKTHCPQGHPYDETNTHYYRSFRVCRECGRQKVARQRQRRKAAA